MKIWILIVTIFGDVVYETGPHTAEECANRLAAAVQYVDNRVRTGQPAEEYGGKIITRADVEIKCRKGK